MLNPYARDLMIVVSNFIEFLDDYRQCEHSHCTWSILMQFASKHRCTVATEDDIWTILECAENELDGLYAGDDDFTFHAEDGMGREWFTERFEEFVCDLCKIAFEMHEWYELNQEKVMSSKLYDDDLFNYLESYGRGGSGKPSKKELARRKERQQDEKELKKVDRWTLKYIGNGVEVD